MQHDFLVSSCFLFVLFVLFSYRSRAEGTHTARTRPQSPGLGLGLHARVGSGGARAAERWAAPHGLKLERRCGRIWHTASFVQKRRSPTACQRPASIALWRSRSPPQRPSAGAQSLNRVGILRVSVSSTATYPQHVPVRPWLWLWLWVPGCAHWHIVVRIPDFLRRLTMFRSSSSSMQPCTAHHGARCTVHGARRPRVDSGGGDIKLAQKPRSRSSFRRGSTNVSPSVRRGPWTVAVFSSCPCPLVYT